MNSRRLKSSANNIRSSFLLHPVKAQLFSLTQAHLANYAKVGCPDLFWVKMGHPPLYMLGTEVDTGMLLVCRADAVASVVP